MILVTKPFLPPKEKYLRLLDEIWERQWLTNHGPLVTTLEDDLSKYLNIPYCSFVSNGTIALQIAIKALDLKGDIITTPFSYVATTSSIAWEGCQPIFADINPKTFNISPDAIRKAITDSTVAILATHVFGNPCEVEQIEQIAKENNIKVIYDAAHAFGVKVNKSSIFKHGDISTCSFHATKLFHTIEGGMVSTNNESLNHRIRYMRNFGHNGPYQFHGVGINGKNSEFHAAMGKANLPYMDEILSKRKYIYETYRDGLEQSSITFQKISSDCEYNYSYVPILLEDNDVLERVVDHLSSHGIYTRRYFRPSLSSLPYTKQQYENTPISNDIADRILCLPSYHDLSSDEIKMIIKLLNKVL